MSIAVFGVTSGQALAGTIGPLIEVPALITLVYVSLWAERRFYPANLTEPTTAARRSARPTNHSSAARTAHLARLRREHLMTKHAIHDEVKAYYADAAKTAECGQAACCGPDPSPWGTSNYDHLDDDLPTAAALASLGCGNPLLVAELHPGETVLDLGSGGGIDVLLSARRVGPDGYVYGLDMTPEMLDLARKNAGEATATNVEFLLGQIEDVPLPDTTVDVIISNCVINLAADKHRVFAEMHRVLRPGGRVGVSDVVTDDHLTDDEREARGTYTGCIAGALPISTYRAGLHDAGFTDIDITITNTVADGVHTAVIRAAKPATTGTECGS